MSPTYVMYHVGGWISVSGTGAVPIDPPGGGGGGNTPPTAPTGLNISSTTSTSTSLAWSASTDSDGTVTGYQVRVNGTLRATVTGLTYVVVGLSAGTPYSIAVRAVDNAGATSTDVTGSLTTLANNPPSAPTNLSVSPSSTTILAASWTASTDTDGTISGYQVRVDGLLTQTVTGTSASITGLTPGTVYSIAVRAVDNAGATSADVIGSGTTTTTAGSPGWLRTAANTGRAAIGNPGLTVYSGSNTLTAGATYTNMQFNMSSQLVLPTNTKLIGCQINSSINKAVYLNGSGQQLTNCDIISSATASSEIMGLFTDKANGQVITSVRMTGYTIFFECDGGGGSPVTIDQCYWYASKTNGGVAAHCDGFTKRAGNTQVNITNTRIDMSTPTGGFLNSTTGAVFTQPTYGSISNLSIQDCYMEGAGNNFTIEAITNITVNNCRTRPTEYASVIIDTRNGPIVNLTWTNNYLWANTPGNDYKGALVST